MGERAQAVYSSFWPCRPGAVSFPLHKDTMHGAGGWGRGGPWVPDIPALPFPLCAAEHLPDPLRGAGHLPVFGGGGCTGPAVQPGWSLLQGLDLWVSLKWSCGVDLPPGSWKFLEVTQAAPAGPVFEPRPSLSLWRPLTCC